MNKNLCFVSLFFVTISCNSYADNNFTGLNVGASVGYGKGESTGDNTYHSPLYNNAFDAYKNIPYNYNVKSSGETFGAQIGYNWNIKDKY